MTDIDSIVAGDLIASDKIRGTNVYNFSGEKLGSVEDIVLDKIRGRAIYAVMSFGGFLGIGEKYFPIPWSVLVYSQAQDGYTVNISKQQLENAPKFDKDHPITWTADYGRSIDNYYGSRSLWR